MPALTYCLGKYWTREALLIASCGGLNTAQAEVESHAPDAILVAGDTQANRLCASLACLACKFRVADLTAYDIHHIGQSFTQNAFGLDRVFDASGAEDGQLNRFADVGRDKQLVARRRMHGPFHHVEVVELADTGVDEIELACSLKAASNFPHIVKRE